MRRFLLASTLAAAFAPAFSQPADAEKGRDLAAACAPCHGTSGAARGGLPRLAGQPQGYIARQLRDFRDAKRPATIMHQIAKGYTEPQMEDIAAFFALQKAH